MDDPANPPLGEERIRQLEAELQQLRAQLAAREASEARYRQLMESNMVGVLFWHTDGRVLEANDAALAITGYSRDDLQQGRINWESMTPPEYADRDREALHSLAKRGICDQFEKEYVRKDGSRIHVVIGGAMLKGSAEEGISYLLDNSKRKTIERQLADSRQLFETFMENIPAVAFIKNEKGERVYLNRRYEEVFANGTKLLGKTDSDMFSPEIVEALQREDAAVLQTRKVSESIVQLPDPEGVVRTWLAYKFPLSLNGSDNLLGGAAIDVTELAGARHALERSNQELEHRVALRTEAIEKANAELRRQIAAKELAQADHRKSESRLRKWLEQSVVSTQVMGPDGFTRQVNRAWEKLWGGTLADITDLNLLTDPQTEARGITAYLRRALSGEVVFVPETPFIPHVGLYQGQARWCSGVVYPIKDDENGAVEEIVILHQDVTDRIHAEQRLQAEERMLRKLLDLQDKERKLIAYEIHDGLVQQLIGAQMQIEAYVKDSPSERVEQAASLLRQAINESRRLITDLRPLVIDEHGVVNAIEFLIAEEERRGAPTIRFFHHVTFDRLPPLIEGTLYRIVQECLNNARRHSGSQEIEVWLHEDSGRLRLIVRDYGCGFSPGDVPDDRFGLESISKRAEIFRGTSHIESIPGEGTSVRVEIPLD
jgi:PAS domain S-box-containing protein